MKRMMTRKGLKTTADDEYSLPKYFTRKGLKTTVPDGGKAKKKLKA